MSLAQHVAAKSREIMPIRSSPSSPKSTTATQLVPTTWQNSEIVEIVPYCFTMFHMRAANQLATCLPRKTVLVDLAKAFTYHMHPHAHSDQTQYVGQCRTYSKPAKQLSVGALLSLAEHSERSHNSLRISSPFYHFYATRFCDVCSMLVPLVPLRSHKADTCHAGHAAWISFL